MLKLFQLSFFIFGAFMLAFSGPVYAQNPHGKTVQQWNIRCNKSTGAPSGCEMYQVVATNNGKKILKIVVGYLEKQLIGAMTVPLGIHFPSGVTMQVDDGQTYSLTVEFCTPNGCRITFSFDDNLLRAAKAGKVMNITFYFFNERQRPFTVPISLSGFTGALKDVF